jgi:hypothetical protein
MPTATNAQRQQREKRGSARASPQEKHAARTYGTADRKRKIGTRDAGVASRWGDY